MLEYEYQAIRRDGFEVSGREYAASMELLSSSLRRQQLTLIRAKVTNTRSVGLAIILPFISEISPLVNSGIPLDRALQIVVEDSTDAKVADVAERTRNNIKRGASFSDALSQAGRFDSFFVALIRVGEASGELPKVLSILETYYQDARKIRQELIASLTYPAILALISILSVVGLAVFVIPVFKDIFADSPEIALPLGTKIIFAFSDFSLHYGWIVILSLAIFASLLMVLFKRSEIALRTWHRVQFRIPVIGELMARFSAFKLSKALSIMLLSGLPLEQSVEIARPLLPNLIQQDGLDDCLAALRKGEAIPQAIAHIPWLPVQLHRYVKLGNETGGLGASLSRVSDLLLDDVRSRLKSFVSLLDPIIIVSMGGMVGFMVISILLAVFSLSDVH